MSTTSGSQTQRAEEAPSKPPMRLNSLHEKFSDPSYLSQDEPGFGSRNTAQAPGNFTLQSFFGYGNSSSSGPGLHSIKTPHSPISHPELAFSPTEIGVWEIHKENAKKTGEAEPGRGFFR